MNRLDAGQVGIPWISASRIGAIGAGCFGRRGAHRIQHIYVMDHRVYLTATRPDRDLPMPAAKHLHNRVRHSAMLMKPPIRFQRLLRSAALGAASLVAMLGIGPSGTRAAAAPRDSGYRPATTVPPSWNRFAGLVQSRFQEALAGDDPAVGRLHAYLDARMTDADAPLDRLVVRAWIGRDGRVERVAFPALSDQQADQDLRTILMRGNIGAAPPQDMLQPISLGLSLELVL
jgi:hypothetical protein